MAVNPQQDRSVHEKLSLWDARDNALASLTDQMKDSFMELATISSSRPLPIQLPLDDQPSILQNPTSSSKSTVLSHNIENSQQFLNWFSEVEVDVETEEEENERALLTELENGSKQCYELLDEVEQALEHLSKLRLDYVQVSTNTNQLHQACEHLLAEQSKLVDTAESIESKLQYFNQLDQVSSKIGSTTLSVTNEKFIPLLSQIDDCLEYLKNHPQYKESQIYTAKFKQCLAKALGFIKQYVFNILENTTQQILPHKHVNVAADDAFTMLYGKFRTHAPRVKVFMEQVEQRANKIPEYEQLLADCHQCYFNQRLLLIGPSVTSAVADLASKHARDHCALVRSGCAFMVHICEDEYQLYYHFFGQHTPALESTLEELCGNLYDVLRPLIIKINHLETLAELCSILKVEMLEEHVLNNPSQLTAFELICCQMLEDVQERLVYRTYIYIRTEILQYNPAAGDLAYPEKLHMMESIAESLRQQAAEKSAASTPRSSVSTPGLVSVPLTDVTPGGGNMPMSPADLHGMWYPTVRRTLHCLSKLYRCIDKTTFQGLSQETLSMCIMSLINASQQIAKRKTANDGHLFLIKHLLILREQIAPFHVDFAVKEMALDFSTLRGAAYELFQSRRKMFQLNSNNAILQFLLEGTPQVMETFRDSKKDVDNQLKSTCEEFISHVTKLLAGPLQDFLEKVDVLMKMKEEDDAPQVTIRQQPWAQPNHLQNVVSQTYRHLKTTRPEVQNLMSLYLANIDTEYILFKPIKANVIDCYQKLHKILSAEYSEEDQQIIACPSQEQINLLLASSGRKSSPAVSKPSSGPATITPEMAPEKRTPTAASKRLAFTAAEPDSSTNSSAANGKDNHLSLDIGLAQSYATSKRESVKADYNRNSDSTTFLVSSPVNGVAESTEDRLDTVDLETSEVAPSSQDKQMTDS